MSHRHTYRKNKKLVGFMAVLFIFSLCGESYCMTEEELLEKFMRLERKIEQQHQQIEKQQEQIHDQQETIRSLKEEFLGGKSGIADKNSPVVDKKQVETLVTKILAERPRAELGPLDFRIFWKEGLRLETRSGDFKLKLGGRIMNDWAWMRQDSDVEHHKKTDGSRIGDLRDGTEFRRVRFYMSGLIYGNIDYKLQFDFADGSSKLKDAYIGIRDLPFGYLRMGHFFEPFGLLTLTSSKYITFIERALPTAFSPGRNTGFMLSSPAFDKRMTWAVGAFRNTDSHGKGTSEGGYNITGRVTALPWYKDKGSRMLHVGVAYSLRNPRDTILYRSTPEAHLAPKFVDTDDITADKVKLLGLEASLVSGPLSVQGEYVMTDVDGKDGYSNPIFDGFYFQGSYFLTGEHRKYSKSKGAFSRVKPKKNYNFKQHGLGAWEIALRYSRIDLSDSRIRGGRLKNITAGLNWYLNPNTRMMWNLIRADLDGVGDSNAVLMRLQVDF